MYNMAWEEDSYVKSQSGKSSKNMLERMQRKFAKQNMDVLRESAAIIKNENFNKLLVEGAKFEVTDAMPTLSKYALEDIKRLNLLQENVGREMLNESAVLGVDNISPIAVNSFGIQERALIATHLPRAVKQIAAKVDNFKLSERVPFIIDLGGNKERFIDAFAQGSELAKNLKEKVTLTAPVNSMDLDLYTTLSVDKERKFDFTSAPKGYTIVDGVKTVTAAEISLTINSNTSIIPETGAFAWRIKYVGAGAVEKFAEISGQFDFSNGKLIRLNSTDPNVTHVLFDMILSPETHHNAIRVGYDMKHTPVHIPVGEHYEYSISEEFKDAADKYYNQDAMALLTELMGRAVEQVKDMNTLVKFEELGKTAIFKGKFDCSSPTGFTQGKEEHIRRQFQPYMEKVAIILKAQTRISNCHFRVIGNPMDIRVADVLGTEYIFKRNQEFFGDIVLDYDFAVQSGVHQIFYISSERIPAGKAYMFLIPNEITNNISTVNHYEYATYVSNQYRGTKSNLPTVMISTRYLTKEYFPVVATIEFTNNQPETA